MTIDTKTFVATAEDIQELTRSNLDAVKDIETTRQTYLRALIGTTQAELKGTKEITEGMQVKSLAIVQKRFYTAVLAVITTADIADNPRLRPEEKTRRSLERNRRSNFARSAYSTLKSWLQSGKDLTTLKPATVSKSQLAAETPRRHMAARAVKPDKIRGKVEALITSLLNSTRQLANADPVEARKVLDEAMQAIAKELFQGAVQPTTDAATAVKEHRPLRVGNGMFWPTDTQVLRRQRLKAVA